MPCRPIYEWGPFIWGMIHTVSIIDFEDPLIQKEHVDKAIYILKNIALIIPCPKCSLHYQTYIENEVLKNKYIYEKMGLFKMTINYHNEINKNLGKDIIEYEESLKKWVKTI